MNGDLNVSEYTYQRRSLEKRLALLKKSKKKGGKKSSNLQIVRKKKSDFKRIQTCTSRLNLEQRITKRIRRIKTSPHSLFKLQKLKSTTRKSYDTNFIEKNKKTVFFGTEKKRKLIQSFGEREKRIKIAQRIKRKEQIDLANQLEKKIKKKRERVEKFCERKKAENLKIVLHKFEQCEKWGFLVAFFSRINFIQEKLYQKKLLNESKEKEKKLELIILNNFLPLIIDRREVRWKNAWNTFKNYFVFFRLWLTIKQKKKAIIMINQFLKEQENVGIQKKFSRHMQIFVKRMKNCQFFIRKFVASQKSRIIVNLLKWKIIQSKLLLNCCLDSNDPVFIKRLNSIGNDNSLFDKKKTEEFVNSFKKVNFLKKKIVKKDNADLGIGYFCLIVPNYRIRVELIEKHIAYEIENNYKLQKKYESDFSKYKKDVKKKQEEIFYDKKLSKIFEDDSSEKQLEFEKKLRKARDEIRKPEKPILRIFSGKRFINVVIKGFKEIQKVEDQTYKKILTDNVINIDFTKRLRDLEKEHFNELKKCDDELKNSFPIVHKKYENLFSDANKVIHMIVNERRKRNGFWSRFNSRSSGKLV